MGDEQAEQLDTEAEPTGDAEEVEVVVAAEDTPAAVSEVPTGIKNRFRKLTDRRKQAEADAAASQAEAQRLQRENDLLRANVRPRRDDYPDDDDAYQVAVEDYQLKRTEQATAQVIDQRLQAPPKDDFDERVEDHANRASKLKVADYDETEDKAIEVLGPVLSSEIVRKLPRSETVMYYLGKNLAKAQEIADLLTTDPVSATLALGRLEAELKVQPKTQRQLEPDTPLEGGSPGGAVDRIEKLREAVAKETDPAKQNAKMAELRQAKREAKAG